MKDYIKPIVDVVLFYSDDVIVVSQQGEYEFDDIWD